MLEMESNQYTGIAAFSVFNKHLRRHLLMAVDDSAAI